MSRLFIRALPLAAALFAGAAAQAATLLNVSCDVSREFYKEYNPLFEAHWQKAGNAEALTINQSHGGSSKQARSVAEGLEADVVTLNQDTDIEFLVKSGVVDADWKKRFPNSASPLSSTVIFLVRAGNPKGIKDWDDLVKPGVQVIVPNPKTSGNGRYTYLAAWAYAKHLKGGSDQSAQAFVGKLFGNVPVLDAGGRGASTTFVQREIGDVLVTFESEVHLTLKELGAEKVQIVYPSASIEAALPVAVATKYVQKNGNAKLARAYLDFLYSPDAQQLGAKFFLRPSDAKILKQHAATFRPIKLYRIDEEFGGWPQAQKTHFDDGGLFDRIYLPKAP